MKRRSSRAIIFIDNQILLMHRIKNDRDYYTFAGGGVDCDETFSQCVVREVLEEFGIKVECDKLIYEYESNRTIQKFYLTKYISGELGTGCGDEFNGNEKYGKYIPEKIDIDKIKDINLFPKIIKSKLLQNIKDNGLELSTCKERIFDYDSEY